MGPDDVEMFSEASENQGGDDDLEQPAGEESVERYREGTARDWRDAGTKKPTGDTGDPASTPGQSTKPGTGEAKSPEAETFREGTARDWRDGQAPDEDESSTSEETRWR